MAQWPNYKKGDWNVLCDSCGVRYKASELKERWDGLMVCSYDWEPRQPQDFVRATSDKMNVPWSRPRPANTYVVVHSFAIAGSAIAGYAIAGNVVGTDIVPPSTFTQS